MLAQKKAPNLPKQEAKLLLEVGSLEINQNLGEIALQRYTFLNQLMMQLNIPR